MVGAGVSLLAANKQSKAITDAANTSTDTQLKMYNQAREDLTPYRVLGAGATTTLASLYGLPDESGNVNPPDYTPFYTSPDYEFAKSEGIKAIDRSAAARGSLLSGGTLKELTAFGEGLATQNYGNYVTRLADLARLGESAGAQTGSFAINVGNNIGATQANAGAAAADVQAQGLLGAGGAIQTGLTNYLRYYNQNLGGTYAGVNV